jgi:hypothetical protein
MGPDSRRLDRQKKLRGCSTKAQSLEALDFASHVDLEPLAPRHRGGKHEHRQRGLRPHSL